MGSRNTIARSGITGMGDAAWGRCYHIIIQHNPFLKVTLTGSDANISPGIRRRGFVASYFQV